MKKIKIGNIEIEQSACLAPMASVADRAYRKICKEYGTAYCVSEMISCKGLYYSDKKTEEMCRIDDIERPMGLQLFGNEPEFYKIAVNIIKKYNPDIIDINMGCPVPKVAGNGSGSALMKTPKLCGEIIQATVKAANCPVTVKIRKGYDKDNINAVEVAKIAEQAGASAITVHGRTREEMYTGKADWQIIKQVKQAVSMPVIGNGDVFTPQDCKNMYDETGCDLVMIGRGTYGRPWIFNQIREYLSTGNILPDPSLDECMEIMLKHISMIVEDKGEKIGIKEARKHAAWYFKGLPNSASFRNRCGQLDSLESLKALIKDFRNEVQL